MNVTRRTWVLGAAALGAIGIAVAVPAALAAPSKTVNITDPAGDVSAPLDLTRVSLQLASDGRLRATMSFAGRVTSKAMLARSGPPGSACLRVWTDARVDPAATRPARLVCFTAASAKAFRGRVYEVNGPTVPKRVADASVTATTSGRSIVIRFTQSALGRPARIRFAGESTRPGCAAVSCIDTAPNGGAPRVFRLR